MAEAGGRQLGGSHSPDICSTANSSAWRHYCYGAKVVHLDSEEWLPFWTDLYDSSRHLYKVQWNWTRPRPIETGENAVTAVASGVIMDVQNLHATVTVNVQSEYDRHARQTLQDASVIGFPASLSQVMK